MLLTIDLKRTRYDARSPLCWGYQSIAATIVEACVYFIRSVRASSRKDQIILLGCRGVAIENRNKTAFMLHIESASTQPLKTIDLSEHNIPL
jgi:hypothetical protein